MTLNHRRTKKSFLVSRSSLSKTGWGSNGESTSSSLLSNVLSKLSGISLVSITSGLTSNSDNSSVNGTRDAVALLDIDLWQGELGVLISIVLLDVSLGGSINHVSHLESLDGLILWSASTAVEASHNVCVTLVLLTSPVISSL